MAAIAEDAIKAYNEIARKAPNPAGWFSIVKHLCSTLPDTGPIRAAPRPFAIRFHDLFYKNKTVFLLDAEYLPSQPVFTLRSLNVLL